MAIVLLLGLSAVLLAVRGARGLPGPEYAVQDGIPVATVTMETAAWKFFPVVDVEQHMVVLRRTSNGWVSAPEFRDEMSWWSTNGQTFIKMIAKVPEQTWRMEMRLGVRRQIRVGGFNMNLPWSTNIWSTGELPPLPEVKILLGQEKRGS